MREWDEFSDKVSKIRPDKEKARSLLKMTALRKKYIEVKSEGFDVLIVEGYYE